MLSVEKCQRILNENAPPGVSYTPEQAERLRGVLYLVARIGLETTSLDDIDHYDDQEANESNHLHPRLYRRAG